MEPSILKYQAFVETARLGSLSAAADMLGYSQSGVSRMVGDLEREWDVRLFQRGRKGILLTPDGERILPLAQELCGTFHNLEERVGEVRGLETGSVRIGTFSSITTYVLPQALGRLQQRHPYINYELLLGDWGEITRWVSSGRVDVGFMPFDPKAGLTAIPLLRDELVAVMPEGHQLAEKSRITLEELAGEPFLMLERGTEGLVPKLFSTAGLSPDVWIRTWDDYAIMALAEAGLGVSVLPALILSRCPFKIVQRPLEPRRWRTIYAVYKSRDALSRASREFLEVVTRGGGLDGAEL